METIAIRAAEAADIPSMVGLLRELFAIEDDFTFDAARQEAGLRLLLDGDERQHCMRVAAAANASVVGMGTAQRLISTAEGGPAAVIEDIVVAPSWRRRGIGRQLLAALEHWARAENIQRLQLLADRANIGALDFYRRLGWQATRLIVLRRRI